MHALSNTFIDPLLSQTDHGGVGMGTYFHLYKHCRQLNCVPLKEAWRYLTTQQGQGPYSLV